MIDDTGFDLCDGNERYAADPPARLRNLQMQLFARVDSSSIRAYTHCGRTRQQAIDYGFTVAEVERYVVWPGQACSYLIGRLRIRELRERAQAALRE